MRRLIEDYVFLSDPQAAALVRRVGSIDFVNSAFNLANARAGPRDAGQ